MPRFREVDGHTPGGQREGAELRGAIPGFKPTASGYGKAQHGVGMLLDGQT